MLALAGLLKAAEMSAGMGQWSQLDGTNSGRLVVCTGGVTGRRAEPRYTCALPTNLFKVADGDKAPTDQDDQQRGLGQVGCTCLMREVCSSCHKYLRSG